MKQSLPQLFSGVLIPFLVSGCSVGSGVALYPVNGTVKYQDGQPMAGGRILFQNIENGNTTSRGVIAQDGTFQLGTMELDDGAAVGKHRVAISPDLPEKYLDDPSARDIARKLIDPRYQSLQTTPLEYTVTTDVSQNHFEIVVERPGLSKK